MLNEITFPSIEKLLILGGDERLTLNENGVNKYGCSPYPEDDILAFSSSTATPLTTSGLQIAQNLRQRLIEDFKNASTAEVYTHEVCRQKKLWKQLLALSEEIDLTFTSSGTDIHSLIASHFVKETVMIMVEINETGSGVANALRSNPNNELISIPLRQTDGHPIDIALIDAQVTHYTHKAIMQKKEVLLILVDQSKTGLIAPSIETTLALKQHFYKQFNVLVDACQFRITQTTLTAYLKHNFMVMVTGSKFLGAPSFSGILFSPKSFNLSDNLESLTMNWGLLIRMEMALAEYTMFSCLNDQNIYDMIEQFATAIIQFLNNSKMLHPLPTPVINRDGLIGIKKWDCLPTIFPFVLEKNSKILTHDETKLYYHQLMNQNPRCYLGQPVLYGNQGRVAMSALRLNLSVPLIVNAIRTNTTDNCIKNAINVLKKLEHLIYTSN